MPLNTQIVGQRMLEFTHEIDARWTMAYAAGLRGRFSAMVLMPLPSPCKSTRKLKPAFPIPCALKPGRKQSPMDLFAGRITSGNAS